MELHLGWFVLVAPFWDMGHLGRGRVSSISHLEPPKVAVSMAADRREHVVTSVCGLSRRTYQAVCVGLRLWLGFYILSYSGWIIETKAVCGRNPFRTQSKMQRVLSTFLERIQNPLLARKGESNRKIIIGGLGQCSTLVRGSFHF